MRSTEESMKLTSISSNLLVDSILFLFVFSSFFFSSLFFFHVHVVCLFLIIEFGARLFTIHI